MLKHLAARYQLNPTRFAALPGGRRRTPACQAQSPGQYDRFLACFVLWFFFALARQRCDFSTCRATDRFAARFCIHRHQCPHRNPAPASFSNPACPLRYRARGWVPFEDLLQHELPTADLCRWPFSGNTPQAQRVITGKTSQALAQAVPTVVGETTAMQGFIHQQNCLLVPKRIKRLPCRYARTFKPLKTERRRKKGRNSLSRTTIPCRRSRPLTVFCKNLDPEAQFYSRNF